MNASPRSQVAAPPAPVRPRLAIVVGRSGVGSMAALGKAQMLMQRGLGPDRVVGCSTGSIFGALIAAGHVRASGRRLGDRIVATDGEALCKPRAGVAGAPIPDGGHRRLAYFCRQTMGTSAAETALGRQP